MLARRGVRYAGLLILVAALFAVTAGLPPAVATLSAEAHAAARAPELPRKKRSGLFRWPRVKASPSKPESRPEDEKGRFITKSRVCRTVNGRRVCFDVYRVRSKRGRSYMIEREDLWRR